MSMADYLLESGTGRTLCGYKLITKTAYQDDSSTNLSMILQPASGKRLAIFSITLMPETVVLANCSVELSFCASSASTTAVKTLFTGIGNSASNRPIHMDFGEAPIMGRADWVLKGLIANQNGSNDVGVTATAVEF